MFLFFEQMESGPDGFLLWADGNCSTLSVKRLSFPTYLVRSP